MTEIDRVKYLRVVLRVIAAVFVLGVYPLTILWPSGWCWDPGQSEYLQMIIGIYATLGLFVWLAARDPERHLSLISFTIWSSVVHASIMVVQSVNNPVYHGHLYGDVPALYIVAAVLAWLSPRAFAFRFGASTA